ncbi:hypothetical protein [Escherichia phage P151]|uniref:Uncharacterized protein n=1 Tax=Escherichia phage P151 TaxID=3114921 RepID=A0ABZ2BL75_9CAUD
MCPPFLRILEVTDYHNDHTFSLRKGFQLGHQSVNRLTLIRVIFHPGDHNRNMVKQDDVTVQAIDHIGQLRKQTVFL